MHGVLGSCLQSCTVCSVSDRKVRLANGSKKNTIYRRYCQRSQEYLQIVTPATATVTHQHSARHRQLKGVRHLLGGKQGPEPKRPLEQVHVGMDAARLVIRLPVRPIQRDLVQRSGRENEKKKKKRSGGGGERVPPRGSFIVTSAQCSPSPNMQPTIYRSRWYTPWD